MLKQICIENVAIIKALQIDFNHGLIALTGETGAGKSLLLDAMLMVFSKKYASKEFLRQGETRGRVELAFDLSTHPQQASIEALLQANGIDCNLSAEELLISRELSVSTSRSRVQGSVVPMDSVEQLGQFLLEMHGQHDLHRLFSASAHRQILDQLGGDPLHTIKMSLKTCFRDWSALQKALDNQQAQQLERARQLDFMAFQLQELAEANLSNPNEDTKLEEERKRLASSEDLLKLFQQSSRALTQGEESSASPQTTLQQVIKNLSSWQASDLAVKQICEHLDSASAHIEESLSALHRASENFESSPERLSEIIDRQDQLGRLKRKYGLTLNDVMACHAKLQIEHDLLQAIEENASENEARCQALKDQYKELASTLTELRQKLITPFEKAIAQHLTDLMLDKAKFEVSLNPLNTPSEHGLDKIEFLFSANPGEPLKPLNQVGSGGELARVMLAIKLQTLQQSGEMLILDEIDAGLSGQALKSLADKLAHLSQHNQVMVVTHHPLLAAKASQHWHLQKGNATKNSTQVIATELTDNGERERVLGLMASGESTQDDVTRQFIQTLLKAG